MLVFCWLFIDIAITDFKEKSLLLKLSLAELNLILFHSFSLQDFLCKIHDKLLKITLPSLTC